MRLENGKLVLFLIFICSILAFNSAFAVPFAEIKVKSKANEDGTFTNIIKINNQGPVLSNVATPLWHVVYTMSGSAVDAGGKLLENDDNIVLFGLDTGEDDVTITHVTNNGSAFQGAAELGWRDTDGDGVKNDVVVWHLPFGPWPDGASLVHGESIRVTFKSSKELSKVSVWVAGSDDDIVWVEGHDMGEDAFGIYDGTDGKYLATFLERSIHVKQKKHKHKHHED